MSRACEAATVPVVRITDLDDPRLADYAHLRDPSRRVAHERDRGIFTVEGWLALDALLTSRYAPRSILVTDDHVERLGAAAVPAYVIPPSAMEAVTGFAFHRGVLAVGERPQAEPAVADVVAEADRILFVEGVNDHENLGALFRNAAAFGAVVVLDPTTADPLYRRSVRVSLGHVLHVPFARVAEGAWPGAIHELRAAGCTTWALTPAGSATVRGEPPAGRIALLVGAEGPGLSPGALGAADRQVRIPMVPGVDSVNVATAAAIALSALYDG
jgi:tRNA G18 (ribose-2'-O)-methylase SpoU